MYQKYDCEEIDRVELELREANSKLQGLRDENMRSNASGK